MDIMDTMGYYHDIIRYYRLLWILCDIMSSFFELKLLNLSVWEVQYSVGLAELASSKHDWALVLVFSINATDNPL